MFRKWAPLISWSRNLTGDDNHEFIETHWEFSAPWPISITFLLLTVAAFFIVVCYTRERIARSSRLASFLSPQWIKGILPFCC